MNTFLIDEPSFTPAEASLMLPLVKRVVDDILDTGKAMRAIGRDPSPSAGDVASYHRLSKRLEECMEELATIGCTYEDWGFGTGMVTFPGKVDGNPVLLSWRNDETEISYYHSYEDGYPGRRRIVPDDHPAYASN